MKIILSFLLVAASGIFCTGWRTGEVCPPFVMLTIKNGKVAGPVVESARTPIVKTELLGDTLAVEFRAEPTGKGMYDFDIPAGAKKIRLFGCNYELPPPDHTAYFRAAEMQNIHGSIWKLQKEEVQFAMVLISVAPDRKTFDVQIRYKVSSGDKIWIHEQNYSCLAAEDGQIIEKLDPGDPSYSAGTRYWSSYRFTNQDGKLRLQLQTTGRFYKYLSKKSLVFNEIELPKPDPRPYTTFFLNMPYKEKYLEEKQSADDFKVKKSVAEFRLLAEKIKRLKCGMTPDETAAILGPPDDFYSHGEKGRNAKLHGFAHYCFPNTDVSGSSSGRNLTVGLYFVKDPDGVFRLKEVY